MEINANYRVEAAKFVEDLDQAMYIDDLVAAVKNMRDLLDEVQAEINALDELNDCGARYSHDER